MCIGRAFKKGFTLVELLVVIAIIAVLMAILMPALQRVRKQAMAAVCENNLHSWALIMQMYTQDHDDRFMLGFDSLVGSGVRDGRHSWMHTLKPYAADVNEIRLCPRANRTVNQGGRMPWAAWEVTNSAWSYVYGDFGSYGINSWVTSDKVDAFQLKADWKWRTMSQRQPNRIPMMLDSGFWLARPLHTDEPPENDGDFAWGLGGGLKRICHDRHNGGINLSFLDLSVRRVRMMRLWQLKWHKQFDTSVFDTMVWPKWIQRYN